MSPKVALTPAPLRLALVGSLCGMLTACGSQATLESSAADVPAPRAGTASGLAPKTLSAPVLAQLDGKMAKLDGALALQRLADVEALEGWVRTSRPGPVEDPGDGQTPPGGDTGEPGSGDGTVVEPTGPQTEFDHGRLSSTFAETLEGLTDVRVSRSGHALDVDVLALRLVAADGSVLGEELVNNAAALAVDQEVPTYAGAFGSAALRFRPVVDHLAMDLVLDALPTLLAGAEGDLSEASLELVETLGLPAGAGLHYWDGESLVFANGPVSVVSAQAVAFGREGDPLFTVPAPFVSDANGERVELSARVTLAGDGAATYATRVPVAWLTDEARAFPVVVDPPVTYTMLTPHMGSVHLDLAPSMTDNIGNLQVTLQDSIQASSLALTATVSWGDGVTEPLAVLPGGYRAQHTYADPNACGGLCQVAIDLCDSLGRCRVETLPLVLRRSNVAGVHSCRFQCWPADDEVLLRSYWLRTDSCETCANVMDENCGNPPPLEQVCEGYCNCGVDEVCNEATGACEPAGGGDPTCDRLACERNDLPCVIEGFDALDPPAAGNTGFVENDIFTTDQGHCFSLPDGALGNDLTWLDPNGGNGIIGVGGEGLINFLGANFDSSVMELALTTTAGHGYAVSFTLREVVFGGRPADLHTFTVEAIDDTTGAVIATRSFDYPVGASSNVFMFFNPTSTETTLRFTANLCASAPACNANLDLGFDNLAIGNAP